MSVVHELDGADVDVLLLDRDLYNTFQPLLDQVATGGLNPGDVTYALRAFAARFGNAAERPLSGLAAGSSRSAMLDRDRPAGRRRPVEAEDHGEHGPGLPGADPDRAL